MLTAILFVTALICYIVLLATYKPQAKYNKGMLFAVILPAHVMDHEEIRNIQTRFNRQLTRASLWMLVFLVPFVLLHAWFAYQVIYFFIWLFTFFVVMVVPFRHAFRDTLALKREQEWFVGTKRDIEGDLQSDLSSIYTDDDEYWGNGFTYHNPHDKRIMVTKRVGIGETVNTATLVGKMIVWGTVGLTVLVIVGVSFMLIRSELTSPTLTITPEHTIEIDYPMYSYEFNIADIEQITLVDQVPSGTKTNGEATDQVARGHFRLKELGKTRLYIFKKNPPYIRIKLENAYIFFNEKDPHLTEQLFEQLQDQIK
jgi:hypothetical protein